MNETLSAEQLSQSKCVPCEGGVPKLTPAEIENQLKVVSGWTVLAEPDRIRKVWTVTNFMAGIRFFNLVAELSESEKHHPDLHLTSYRNVAIEIWTHAIQGLSINDFILAAKIDQLGVETRPSR